MAELSVRADKLAAADTEVELELSLQAGDYISTKSVTLKVRLSFLNPESWTCEVLCLGEWGAF